MAIITGTNDSEVLSGTSDSDLMRGLGGNDLLFAYAGDDTLFGGDGDDRLEGSSGDDALYGGDGDDWLILNAGGGPFPAETTIAHGGPGDDLFTFGSHEVISVSLLFGTRHGDYDGGAGRDEAIMASVNGDAFFQIDLASGDITVFDDLGQRTTLDNVFRNFEDFVAPGGSSLILRATDDANTIRMSTGDDVVSGFGGDDSIQGWHGDDKLYGGDGVDELIGWEGLDDLFGGGDGDYIYGGGGNDLLNGGAGDDTLRGGEGSDQFVGGQGDDELRGDKGADKLRGSKGDDLIYGGLGRDVMFMKERWGTDTFADFTDGEDKVRIFGHDFDDLTIAQNGGDVSIAFADAVVILENTDIGDISSADFIFT